jgi:hypothetical protein
MIYDASGGIKASFCIVTTLSSLSVTALASLSITVLASLGIATLASLGIAALASLGTALTSLSITALASLAVTALASLSITALASLAFAFIHNTAVSFSMVSSSLSSSSSHFRGVIFILSCYTFHENWRALLWRMMRTVVAPNKNSVCSSKKGSISSTQHTKSFLTVYPIVDTMKHRF